MAEAEAEAAPGTSVAAADVAMADATAAATAAALSELGLSAMPETMSALRLAVSACLGTLNPGCTFDASVASAERRDRVLEARKHITTLLRARV